MKMHSQRLRTTKRILGLVLPAVAAALLVMGAVLEVPLPVAWSDAGHTATAPLWKAREAVRATVVATYESLEGMESLVSDNTALRNELSIMRRENFAARALERENVRLRALVGRGEEDPIIASVLNDERYAPYDSFILDRGSLQGVVVGMVVTTAEGVALGTVTHVLSESAVATQFSAPDIKTTVVIEASSTSVQVAFIGMGAGTLVFDAPRDFEVREGDLVTLPSFHGYPIGEVVYIESAPEEAHKTVYARQMARSSEVRYVRVQSPLTEVVTEGEEMTP